jgi:hypothetical protein
LRSHRAQHKKIKWPKLDSKKSFGARKSNGLNWIAKNLLEQENKMVLTG